MMLHGSCVAGLLAVVLMGGLPALNGVSAAAQSTSGAAPEGPSAQATAAPAFPPANPANFTAKLPTAATVDAFFKQNWGYDPNRTWEVAAVQSTPVQGLSKVTVFAEEKGSGQPAQAISFFVLPDERHMIAGDDVLPFGTQPFADYRRTLQNEANGPSMGGSAKELELVEFADFQCPHCKEAQPTIKRLLQDYPNAHYVYENFPLSSIHSEALKASEYSVCVMQAGGDAAFFKFADATYEKQAGLTPQDSAATLAAAATAAGQDPAKIAACAATPQAKAAVDAQRQLGEDVGVNQTPFLFVNGRGLPLGGIPYETLKQIVNYQMQLDGVQAGTK